MNVVLQGDPKNGPHKIFVFQNRNIRKQVTENVLSYVNHSKSTVRYVFNFSNNDGSSLQKRLDGFTSHFISNFNE